MRERTTPVFLRVRYLVYVNTTQEEVCPRILWIQQPTGITNLYKTLCSRYTDISALLYRRIIVVTDKGKNRTHVFRRDMPHEKRVMIRQKIDPVEVDVMVNKVTNALYFHLRGIGAEVHDQMSRRNRVWLKDN